MKSFKDLDGDFWRGLGGVVVVPGIAVLYFLGLVSGAIDAIFGGRWAEQDAEWTVGSAAYLVLATAYGYCAGYWLGRSRD